MGRKNLYDETTYKHIFLIGKPDFLPTILQLPLAFESGGMSGVINVDVGGFFQGSLMCEIIVYVGQDFHGSEADLEKVLMPNESSPRFADDTRELLIRRNSVTVHGMNLLLYYSCPL